MNAPIPRFTRGPTSMMISQTQEEEELEEEDDSAIIPSPVESNAAISHPTRTRTVAAATTAPAATAATTNHHHAPPPVGQVDRVNGIGMWRSWTRSFNTPLRALLDLFDNAVDAAMPPNGHPPLRLQPKIDMSIDSKHGQGGVIMRNSCLQPIPQMAQVLEVYKSCKGNDAIGENGIGVKHSCANLSKCTFLLTKTPDHFSMGVLMEDLQRNEGCVLPSVEWEVEIELDQALRNLCFHEPTSTTWGRAIRQYGDNDLELGMDRILNKLEGTRQDGWQHYPYVFTVILTQLRHGKQSGEDEHKLAPSDSPARPQRRHHHNQHPNQQQQQHNNEEQGDYQNARSHELLEELRTKLPQLYLHIHPIEITIQNQVLRNLYWERRLIEITEFHIAINPSVPWEKDMNLSATDDSQFPTIRFFVGFDPERASAKKESSFNLYIHSRESGRQIKVHKDARSLLGMVTGSTDYKQGLTVIMDDIHGTLPLNPTKQDLAFGFTEHGQIHHANILEWAGAVARFYWSFHFERLGNSKETLTQAVYSGNELLAELRQHADDQLLDVEEIPPLSRSTFITYADLNWKALQHKIRISKHDRVAAVPIPGPQTRLRLPFLAPTTKIKSSPARASKRAAAAAAAAQQQQLMAAKEVVDETSDGTTTSDLKRRKQSARKSVGGRIVPVRAHARNLSRTVDDIIMGGDGAASSTPSTEEEEKEEEGEEFYDEHGYVISRVSKKRKATDDGDQQVFNHYKKRIDELQYEVSEKTNRCDAQQTQIQKLHWEIRQYKQGPNPQAEQSQLIEKAKNLEEKKQRYRNWRKELEEYGQKVQADRNDLNTEKADLASQRAVFVMQRQQNGNGSTATPEKIVRRLRLDLEYQKNLTKQKDDRIRSLIQSNQELQAETDLLQGRVGQLERYQNDEI